MTEDRTPEPGPLDRALKAFGDMRPGEGATVLYVKIAENSPDYAVNNPPLREKST